jgi:hypothetical protein
VCGVVLMLEPKCRALEHVAVKLLGLATMGVNYISMYLGTWLHKKISLSLTRRFSHSHLLLSLSLYSTLLYSTLHTPQTTQNRMSSTRSSRRGNRPNTGRPGASTLASNRSTTSRSRGSRAMASTVGGGPRTICAVSESRGVSATVGLCIINLYTGECHLSEICDSQTYVHTISKIFVNDVSDVMDPFL